MKAITEEEASWTDYLRARRRALDEQWNGNYAP
jgi:hypothetical protein